MKRMIVFFGLLCLFGYSLCAFDNVSENIDDHLIVTMGMGFFFPLVEDTNPGLNVLSSLLLSSFSMGAGYHLNIIPDILSPGIYADIHISLLDMLFGSGNDDTLDDSILFFQTGIRFYNQFRLRSFDLLPFAGLHFAFTDGFASGAKMFGLLALNGNFGIEYSYHSTVFSLDRTPFNDGVHRIMFVYRLW